MLETVYVDDNFGMLVRNILMPTSTSQVGNHNKVINITLSPKPLQPLVIVQLWHPRINIFEKLEMLDQVPSHILRFGQVKVVLRGPRNGGQKEMIHQCISDDIPYCSPSDRLSLNYYRPLICCKDIFEIQQRCTQDKL